MKYLGIGSFAEVISHVTTKKAKDMYRFTVDHLGEEMATVVDALLHILTSGEVQNSDLSDELTDIPGLDVTAELKNDEKLVKIACNLLFIVARDNEDAKRLIAQSGLLATLCESCIDYLESGVSIGETLLNLLKLIACNPITQAAFVEDGLSKLLRYLVEADRPETHNHATVVFHSLASNPQAHPTVVKNGLLPLLLILRNSKDLESRRVSLESLLNFVENSAIHPLIRDEYDLVQTIVAISKFGINKNVKERAADAILELMGKEKLPPHLARIQAQRDRAAAKASSPSSRKKVPPLSLPPRQPPDEVESHHSEEAPDEDQDPQTDATHLKPQTDLPFDPKRVSGKPPSAKGPPLLDSDQQLEDSNLDNPAQPSTPDVTVQVQKKIINPDDKPSTVSELDPTYEFPDSDLPSPKEVEQTDPQTQS